MPFFLKIKRKLYKFFHPVLGEILMLHRVVNKHSILDANREMEITPEFLEKTILKYMAKGYRFVSLNDVYEIVINKKKVKNKFVCFTFDDGYIDNYESAYPIFKKHQCPFTIFITTNFPDGKALVWWYFLEDIIIKNDKLLLEDGTQYDCSTIEMKNATFTAIRLKIFDLQLNSIESLFCYLSTKYNYAFQGKNEDLSLSWDQIRNLSKDPLCTIGSHAVSHVALDRLNEDMVLEELINSKEELEKHIMKSVYHFAYPYGRSNDGIIDKLKQLGFKTAVIANGGKVRNDSNPLKLERVSLIDK